MDRMSGLADDIIHLIVGFLSAKDAACVPVLAKRFRNLFTIIKDLVLDAEKIPGIEGRFTDHVYGVLGQLESGTRIKSFTLKCPRGLGPDHVNDWVRTVLKRGIMDLELSISGNGEYNLPREIFSCNTLVRLELGSEIVIGDVPTNASLPSLETLRLDLVKFQAIGDCPLKAFLLACPVLYELVIDGGWCWDTWRWAGILSSPSLRRLIIHRTMYNGLDGADYQGISFDTPSLTYLEYCDFVPDAYPVVNLESLEEAKLFLQVVAERQWHGDYAAYGDPLSSNPTNLIQGIRNVKVLELSHPLTFETLYCFRQEIPVFQKLHRLIINNDDDLVCWSFLRFLLNKSPNLKTLILKGGLHYVRKNRYEENDDHDYVCQCVSGYAYLLSCPVEVLDIYLWDDGTEGELEQIEHFLGKLSCLELLTVRGRVTAMEKSRIITHLLMLPRASHRCRIEFI